jgi:hypothetical protein
LKIESGHSDNDSWQLAVGTVVVTAGVAVHRFVVVVDTLPRTVNIGLCVHQGHVSLSSYTDCVDWRAVCWKQFSLKNRIITGSVTRMDRFVTRKCVSEKYESVVSQRPSTGRTETKMYCCYKF